MKKVTLMAIAGACALAVAAPSVWASAGTFQPHNKKNLGREDDTPTTSVPEPGTMALLALGLGGLGLARRRKKD